MEACAIWEKILTSATRASEDLLKAIWQRFWGGFKTIRATFIEHRAHEAYTATVETCNAGWTEFSISVDTLSVHSVPTARFFYTIQRQVAEIFVESHPYCVGSVRRTTFTLLPLKAPQVLSSLLVRLRGPFVIPGFLCLCEWWNRIIHKDRWWSVFLDVYVCRL